VESSSFAGAGAAGALPSAGRSDAPESENASASRWTKINCERPMRMMSPGRSSQSPATRCSPTIVPLRLSRSRSVHWPAEKNTSTWFRLHRSSRMTIWLVGARPMVTACPGTSRKTSLHFPPSRMTRYASSDTAETGDSAGKLLRRNAPG